MNGGENEEYEEKLEHSVILRCLNHKGIETTYILTQSKTHIHMNVQSKWFKVTATRGCKE